MSNAAAYLFAEFDRLNILHSEFFVEQQHVSAMRPKSDARSEPCAALSIRSSIRPSSSPAKILSQLPDNADALFAKILTLGLRADYDALIEQP